MASRRPGKKQASSKTASFRLTPGERADLAWLARRQAVTDAEALRILISQEMDRLVAAGIKVPRR